jgi:hypothetical protein
MAHETAGEQWPFETALFLFFRHSASVVAAAFSEGKATAYEKGDKQLASHRSGTALPTFLPTRAAARSRSRSLFTRRRPTASRAVQSFRSPSLHAPAAMSDAFTILNKRQEWMVRSTNDSSTAAESGAIRWTVVAARPPFVSAAASDPSACCEPVESGRAIGAALGE